MYAVQLAKHFGAEVTGVCSTKNLDLVRSFGADKVVDYTTNEPTTCAETFDVVVDAVGKLSPALAARLSAPSGRRLSVAKDVGPIRSITTAELQFLASLVDRGELRTFIDREYPLERIVEAHAYVQQGHKRGHVVITC
jgi:NADPH:quinone reductase-like Zn-dependent oxidoreductase